MMRFLSCILFIGLIRCTTKTEVYESQMNKEFANGQTIFVKKTDEVSRIRGALTGRLWDERHSFRYQFTIQPHEIEWQGLLGESPKAVLNCNQDLYLKTTTEQVVSDTVKHTISTVTKANYYHHVDNRYFFRMFGDQYFVMVDSLVYQEKNKSCEEQYVPNM